ncbi:MAG TPA: sugar ABC transporter permease [Gaiellaceae bacterium]
MSDEADALPTSESRRSTLLARAPRKRRPGLEGAAWRRRPRSGELVWYAFVGPPFLLLLLFVAYPTFETFKQSVYEQVGTHQQFAGLTQFSQLVEGSDLWSALENTVILGAAYLAIVIPLAVVVASLLNRVRRGATPLKVIYFLPQLTSSVAVAIMFNYVFQPDWGLLNGTLHRFGVQSTPLWLADPRLSFTGSRAAVTILAVWAGLGYFMLIVLAGLQAIPVELYEAAAIDGANAFQIWWRITLPSLRPTFIFLLMTGAFDAMSRFSDLWTLGGPSGSPAGSLQSVVVFLFQTAFEAGNMNRAAAIAVILFVLMLFLTIASFQASLAREFAERRRSGR